MNFEVLKDFELHSKVPYELVEKYTGKIPLELLEMWQDYGFGTFANGYMKIINPDDYIKILRESYFASDESIPIFVTGLADIVTWQDNKYVGLVKYRKSDVDIYLFEFEDFITDFYDLDTTEFLDNIQFERAVQLFGKLEYDECFGNMPLLALGGSNKAEKMEKVKILPYICQITQTAGRIE